MGLIKTAIMTGGGIYAVNKLAKAAEQRNNSPNRNQGQQYSQQQQPQQQNNDGYYQAPQHQDHQYRDEHQRQVSPQYRGQEDHQYTGRQPFPATSQTRGQYNPADYANDNGKIEYDADGWQVQPRGNEGPPPYSGQHQQSQNQQRAIEQGGSSGRGSPFEEIADAAMGLFEKSGKGKKGDKAGLVGIFGGK